MKRFCQENIQTSFDLKHGNMGYFVISSHLTKRLEKRWNEWVAEMLVYTSTSTCL